MGDIGKAITTLFWGLLLFAMACLLVAIGAVLWAVLG